MSFRFSVGDIIATAQLCRSVIAETLSGKLDSSNSSPRAIQVLKRLQWSLDRLADGLTSSESIEMLAQQNFGKPLRDGLSQIRRDVEAFSEASKKQRRVRGSLRSLHGRAWASIHSSSKEVEACIERLSEASVNLSLLLSFVSYTNSQEPRLSTETLSQNVSHTLSLVNSFGEDTKIRQWLFRSEQWEQEERHAQLVSSREEQTCLWILEDPRYQIWKNSQNSLLWLWGMRM